MMWRNKQTVEEEERTTRKTFPMRATKLWHQEWVKGRDGSTDSRSVNWANGDGF